MEKDEHFSSSSDFVKSLEPKYGSYSDQEKNLLEKLKKTTQKKKEKSETDDRQNSEPQQSDGLLSEPFNPHAPHRRKRFEFFAAGYLLFMLVLLAFLSVSTDTNPFIVLISLLPTILTIVVAMIIYEAGKDNKNILWVVPLVLIFGFHWYGTNSGGIFAGLAVDILTALNIFLSFLYLIVNYFLLQKDFEEMPLETPVSATNEPPADLSTYIASIEDKSKALNFVIGRVYNSYHGGSRELREKINMKQEWYDQFSQIPAEPNKIDFRSLKILIITIERRLKGLEKTEKEVFGLGHRQFKNLVRNDAGTDRIIDVLDKNDKDPVKSYYEGALQFCGKVKEFMQHRKAPEIQNDYVLRPSEKKKKSSAESGVWSGLKKLKKN